MHRRSVAQLAMAALAAAATAASAQGQVFARGPSLARAGTVVEIVVEGFSRGTPVWIRVTGPGRIVNKAAAIAGDDGLVTYSLVPSLAGSWSVTVGDANDRKAEFRLQATP